MLALSTLVSGPLVHVPAVGAAVATIMPTNAGSFTLSGATVLLTTKEVVTARARVLTRVPASLNVSTAEEPYSYPLTGNAAQFTMAQGNGTFALGGAVVSHRAGDEHRSGTPFTRRRYRDLLDAAEAEQEAERQSKAQEAARAAALRQAADARAKAALRVRWAQQDAIAAAAAEMRAAQSALAALAGTKRLEQVTQETAAMRRAVLQAQAAQAEQDEEEEAIALLMLTS